MEILRALHPDDIPGERERIAGKEDERESEVADCVVSLLNVAVIFSVGSTDAHCQMCGFYGDEHTVGCPIPLLEDWLAARR